MNEKSARTWKIVAIVFMGLTTAMNLLGGVGTICAAFLTKQYPPMWVFMDYQWLYQPLMILTILIGIAGVWSTIQLIKGGKNVFRNVMIILIVGTILGGTQYFASLAIRGKGVPANVKFYANLATLLLFLVLNSPLFKTKMDFSKPIKKSDKTMAGGMAAFISGLIILSVFIWAGPSHTYQGDNWVEVFLIPILVNGTFLTVGGLIALTKSFIQIKKEDQMRVTSSSSDG
ncbi:MAG: hypothetical protein HON98_03090 [Chloroflexi bacterium]|jgi:hypothetical protein|nr:hypothetical protein [Chloroflexota bacterium]MBT3670342.1 hypothetical protein [Chloroflexota bacterium]MBT4002594.1 hypothetical protein [Chloroflexota bacterium]MBT4305529.1 hypothetical protein [Chloroflexota bacterium]MBT4533141.1 hypothetical protein [Chloroflexota bacterium]